MLNSRDSTAAICLSSASALAAIALFAS